MTEQRRNPEEEIERALDTLDRAESAEGSEEVDSAFRKLVRLLPPESPRHDFSQRVMAAVRSAPLPADRRKLRAPRRTRVLAAAATATAALGGILWAMPFAQVFVVRMFLTIVQGSVLAIRWARFIPEAWSWMDLATRPLSEMMGSPQILSVFVAGMLLSLGALAALAHVVSASRPERTGY